MKEPGSTTKGKGSPPPLAGGDRRGGRNHPTRPVARVDMELPDGRYLLVYSKPVTPRA